VKNKERRLLARTTAFVSLMIGMKATTSAAAPPNIDTFAAYSDFGAVTLSPDGNRVAYTSRAGGKRTLIVLDLEKRTVKAILPAEQDRLQIQWCSFKTAERILCGLRGVDFMGLQPYPVSRLFAINADGSKPDVLVQKGQYGASQYQDNILDWQDEDPTHVLIQLMPPDARTPFPEVFSLDVVTGRTAKVQAQRFPIRYWHSDDKGIVRYGWGCDDDKRCEYITRDSADAPWRVLKRWDRFENESNFSVLGFGPSGDKLLVTETLQDRDAVYQLDLGDKADKDLVFLHPQVDVGGVIKWPNTNRPIGFWYETDRYRREIFDADALAIYQVVDKSLPGTINHIVDTARDNKLLLISSYSDVLPAQYYLLDLEKKALRKLSTIAPDLAQAPLAPMQVVKIPATDGTILPGYLTLPVGSEGKNLPLVVYPHGGPHARDSWGFDEMVQFMASRGYAVLQVNFRGSTGYGDAWYDAGLRKWGTVMVDDVNAAARWALSQGIGDPKRTCIVGWSFGGYAALMGAIKDPELYRCVASIAGVTDLRALTWQLKGYYGGGGTSDYTLGTEADELRAGSPIKSAKQLKAPVLMVHGKSDTQVEYDQSVRMNRALDDRQKHELVLIDGGDHSLSRFEWRKMLLTKLEAFLAENLK
jgi:dipeptidyl aminopeptidase/acylaminoacyl peptidase